MKTIPPSALLCFDNDGTLFASHEVANPAIQREYVRFCRSHGYEANAPSDEEICRLTGKPGPEFYAEILPPPLRDLAPQFRLLCLGEEVREVMERGRLFPGVEEMLLGLRAQGRRLVLVTNAGERYLKAVACRVGYDRLLDGIYHYGKGGLLRKSDMILAALADFGAESAVMVGDRASDLEGARDSKAFFVGCLYGYGLEEEIRGADLLAGDVPELARILGLQHPPSSASSSS